MKLSTFSSYFLACCTLLSSCKPKEDADSVKPAPTPISYSVIKADSSDIALQPAFGWDIQMDGKFDLEENCFFDPNAYFSFNSHLYQAKYTGIPIIHSRVFNQTMCFWSSCDTSDFTPASSWRNVGNMPATRKLSWDFINFSKEQSYRVELESPPAALQILSKPEVLSTTDDNILLFQKSSPKDSVLFNLVIIPKAHLKQKPPTGTIIFTQLIYPFKAQADRIVIPGKQLINSYNGTPITPADTVFINLVAIRRVVKLIEGKKIAITYRVNNLQPIRVD